MDIVRTQNHAASPTAGAPRAETAAERLFDALVHWWRRRETSNTLMNCSDRVLADIGIARDDIPLIAKGVDPASVTPRGAALHRQWQGLLDRIFGLRNAEQPEQRACRELMAYSDRELDELGIRRADIPALTRRASPTAAA
jgi:uncharacterized protein YjiS (DUF1127 family)